MTCYVQVIPLKMSFLYRGEERHLKQSGFIIPSPLIMGRRRNSALPGNATRPLNIPRILSKHRQSNTKDLAQLFAELRIAAQYLSPKSATECLQVPARLVGYNAELARLDLGQGDLVRALCAVVLEYVDPCGTPKSTLRSLKETNLSIRDISQAAWSLGRTGQQHPGMLQLVETVYAASEKVRGPGSEQLSRHDSSSELSPTSVDLSTTLWACSRLSNTNHSLSRCLIRSSLPRLSRFDGHSIAALFVALAGASDEDLPEELTTLFGWKNGVRPSPDKFELISLEETSVDDSSYLETTVFAHLEEFGCRRLCNFIWACAKLSWRPVPLLKETCRLLIELVHEMTPQHIANVWWSLGQLRIMHSSLIQALTQTLTQKHQVARQDPQGVSNIFWALARLGITPLPLIRCLIDQAYKVSSRLIPQHIANIAWACGSGNLPGAEGLFPLLQSAAERMMNDFDPQNASNFFWGLSRTCWEPSPRLLPPTGTSRAFESLVLLVGSFGSQPLANLMIALAKWNYKHPLLIHAIVRQTEAVLQESQNTTTKFVGRRASVGDKRDVLRVQDKKPSHFDAQRIANLTWAFATLYRSWSAISADHDQQAKSITRLFTKIANALNAGDISEAGVDNHRRANPECPLRGMALQHMSLIAWSFASLRLLDFRLFYNICSEMCYRIPSFGQRNDQVMSDAVPALSQTLWAFGRSFYRHEGFLSATLENLKGDLKSFRTDSKSSWFFRNARPQNVANVLWGLIVLIFGASVDGNADGEHNSPISSSTDDSDGSEKVKLVTLAGHAWVHNGVRKRRSSSFVVEEYDKGLLEQQMGDLLDMCLDLLPRLVAGPAVFVDARDLGQLHHAILCCQSYLKERRLSNREGSLSDKELILQRCFNSLDQTAPEIIKPSATHVRIREILQHCVDDELRKCLPDWRFQVREEESLKPLLSVDLVVEGRREGETINSAKTSSPAIRILIEIDGPWHFVRCIGIKHSGPGYAIRWDGKSRLKRYLLTRQPLSDEKQQIVYIPFFDVPAPDALKKKLINIFIATQ